MPRLAREGRASGLQATAFLRTNRRLLVEVDRVRRNWPALFPGDLFFKGATWLSKPNALSAPILFNEYYSRYLKRGSDGEDRISRELPSFLFEVYDGRKA